MRMPVANVCDLDVCKPRARAAPRVPRDVLPVLRAAGVAALRGGNEADRAADARARHLGQRIGEKGMPVAHADIHRQLDAALVQPLAQHIRLPHRQLGEWRHAAEEFVMMRHFLDALRRNASAAQHVREERPHVLGPLRAAEGDDAEPRRNTCATARLYSSAYASLR